MSDDPKRWWQNPVYIGALATLAAAILPVTTLVQNLYQSSNDLALQRAKHFNRTLTFQSSQVKSTTAR